MTEKTYISAKDTAKLIRRQLKAFAGVKFSVRSDYNSINVKWTDGPTSRQVEAIVNAYKGGSFDGSIDLAYTCESWLLADGTAAPAYCGGTTGSMGSDDGYAYAPPADDAQLVQFEAKYIFCDRSYSRELLEHAIAETSEKWGIEDAPTVVDGFTTAYLANDKYVPSANEYSLHLVMRVAQDIAC